MIKTITFDFGGVLYHYDGEVLLTELSRKSDLSPDLYRELLGSSSLDKAHFRGEINAEELLEILKEKAGLSMTVEELADAYANSVRPNEDMFDLVRALEDDYNIQLYSDTPEILYHRVMREMPIFDAFSAITLSYEVGELKDSPEGHEDMITKSGHDPEEIIFIDDREEFVSKAKELGINGIRFKNFDHLLEDLERHGVKLDGKLSRDGR